MSLWNPLTWLDLNTSPSPRPLREAAGATIDADEAAWRPLTGDDRRALLPVTQQRMQDLAVFLWQANPLANRLIELPVAYLLADGVKLEATVEDPELRAIVQEWLDRLWLHPVNNFPLRLPDRLRELAVFGEQCWPAFVNPADGSVRYGYLDPGEIETVVTDPDNSQQPIGVVTRRNRKGQQRRYRVIVNGPEAELFTARTRAIRESFTDGDAHFWAVNKLASERRGRSDLLPVMDWCDAYEQYLFGEVDRAGALRSFIWDVKLTGATPEEVATRAGQIGPPAPGSVRVHNDEEEWEAVTPDLKATDGAEGARLFRNHILGAATLPEHWFGGGGEVNRSTSESMGEPTFKLMSLRQQFLGAMLTECGRYQIRQREWATTGREPDLFDPVYQIEARFPEMIVKDTTKYAGALQQVVVACGLAIDKGLLSDRTALALIDAIAGRLGVGIDTEAELAAAQAAASARAEADGDFTLPVVDEA